MMSSAAPNEPPACPSDDELGLYVEGRLDAERCTALREHVGECTRCRELVSMLSEQGGSDPGSAITMLGDDEPRREDPIAVGSRLGRYVVLGRLGAGGMGVVLSGYDPEIDRKVALKLLRLPRAGDEAQRRRLIREARAMGQLSHPNVIAVFDVGQSDAGIFVAMEHIDGLTLDAWARERPRRVGEILEVYRQTGRGLAAAHDQGLVHRDFKPGNAMIDRDGRVRVLDFGLAQLAGPPGQAMATGSTEPATPGVTQEGALVGTPAYMAPEQIRGEPTDARSDQFSFCVALYEALHGERPFMGPSLAALAASVLEGRTRMPRGAGVPRFVQRAVLRGLAVEPAQRWPDMHALLHAIDPAPRRRRRFALLGGTLLVGAMGAIRLYAPASEDPPCEGAEARFSQAYDPERAAKAERAFTEGEVRYGAEAWQTAKAQLDAYAERWIAGHTDACEAHHVRREQSATMLDRRMACLERARQEVTATMELLAEPDAEVIERAVTLVAGLPRVERCADVPALLAELPPPEDPQTARRVTALSATLSQASTLGRAGRFDDALALATAAITTADQLDYPPAAGRARLVAGEIHKAAGHVEPAESMLTEAYWLARPLGDDPTIIDAETSLVVVTGYRRQRFDDARGWARHAKADIERTGGDPERWHRYHRNVGTTAMAENRFDEAFAAFDRALELCESLYGVHPLTAQALSNLGIAHLRHNRADEAIAHFERALELQTELLGERHPARFDTLNNLASAHLARGQPDAAVAPLRAAIELGEAVWGADSPRVAEALVNLGVAQLEQDRYDEAEVSLTRALDLHTRTYGPRHSYVGTTLYNLGEVAARRGDPETALARYREALVVFEAVLGAEHAELSEPLLFIAKAELDAGRPAAAAAASERAEALCEPEARLAEVCAKVRFTRARAMVGEPSTRDDARALAERARRELRAIDPAHAELASIERWQHEHAKTTEPAGAR